MATLDQVYSAVNALQAQVAGMSAALTAVIVNQGVIMSQQDNIGAQITADTAAINALAGQLNTARNAIAAQITALQGAVTAGHVDQSVVDGLNMALANLSPAVEQVAALGTPPAPAPPPAAP